jgi:hypothetical protein
MDTQDIRLCEVSSTLDEAWRKLYESAFPDAEREPEDKLTRLLGSGDMLLHRTLNKEGEMVCFTLISLAPDFSFLAYMATDPTKRSGGYGSKHLKRLIELLKEKYPSHLGLFLEIEATNPTTVTVTDDEKKLRERRYSFYQRLGAKRVCKSGKYFTPSKVSGGQDWEGELLDIPFVSELTNDQRQQVVSEILQRFYCLKADDALVVKNVSQFKQCGTDSDSAPAQAADNGQPSNAADKAAGDTSQPQRTDTVQAADSSSNTPVGETVTPVPMTSECQVTSANNPGKEEEKGKTAEATTVVSDVPVEKSAGASAEPEVVATVDEPVKSGDEPADKAVAAQPEVTVAPQDPPASLPSVEADGGESKAK